MNPNYPLYIPSKGRWESRLTSKALELMNIPYKIVVEDQEYKKYCSVIDKKKILILDKSYQDNYDVFNDLGDNTGSKGSGPARNFIWDHSISMGFDYHWIMDDNIWRFFRFNKNMQIPMGDGTFFKIMEDFVLRYENVLMAGPNYDFFIPRRKKCKPYTLNTRIYSCNLIKNSAPYRWRGRYNEDTDLSLRMLKDGYCTILFNIFLQKKSMTQAIKGGNTDSVYKHGTYAKSKQLQEMHPDVTKVVMRWGRIHHYVDYRRFKKNKLIRDLKIEVKKGINDYGMKLHNNKKIRK